MDTILRDHLAWLGDADDAAILAWLGDADDAAITQLEDPQTGRRQWPRPTG